MGFRVALGAGDNASRSRRAWNTDTAAGDGPGAELFADNCAACHLRSDDFEGLYGKSRRELTDAIRKRRQ